MTRDVGPGTIKHIIIILVFIFATQSLAENYEQGSGTRYQTFVTTPQNIDLYWRDSNGTQYRDFAALQAALMSESKTIRFMMNAGIFEPDGVPTGLLVINGKTQHDINTREGEGNFYLQPNGVFWVDSTGAHITSTKEYVALEPAPRIAIQSGPLLLRRSRINPVFKSESENRLHRNGVGIRKDGAVLFAITDFDQAKHPNLHEFATHFMEQGCTDALFLDGDLSEMVTDVKERLPAGNRYGAIFAVTEETNRAQQGGPGYPPQGVGSPDP